jgi:alpha-galactosidase
MVMWHENEPVETAAFQLLNVLFSVPQLSVKLREIPPDHLAMVKFYTEYWLANRDVLLDGTLEASTPLANYTMVKARTRDKQIIALYADMVARVTEPTHRIDLINAKHSDNIIVAADTDAGLFDYAIRDCQGLTVRRGMVRLGNQPQRIDVPTSGLVAFVRR